MNDSYWIYKGLDGAWHFGTSGDYAQEQFVRMVLALIAVSIILFAAMIWFFCWATVRLVVLAAKQPALGVPALATWVLLWVAIGWISKAQPSTAAAPVVAAVTPTAAATPTLAPPTVTATTPPLLSAEQAWDQVVPQLDATWGNDWLGAIDILRRYLERYPNEMAAKEKLYAARVEYAKQLGRDGHPADGVQQIGLAEALLPGRPEAGEVLRELHAMQGAVPTLVIPQATSAPTPTPTPTSGRAGQNAGALPQPPRVLARYDAQTGGYLITWESPSDRLWGFRIKRHGQPIDDVGASARSYLDKKAPPNDVPSYQVCAYNEIGENCSFGTGPVRRN